jgi:bacterioferritin
MDKAKIIKKLNEALERELNEVVRYLHQSFLVFGPDRKPIVELFRENSRESMEHATQLGEKIVALGGDPVVKILEIYEPKRLSTAEMLANDLKQETEALEGYKAMLPLVEGDVALTSMISRLIEEETEHVEEMGKMVREK